MTTLPFSFVLLLAVLLNHHHPLWLNAVCKAGYGGAGCNVCGGDNPTYGPDTLRPIGQACLQCPGLGGADGGGGVGGYSFLDPKGGTNFFTPRVIAAIAATQPSECIGEFTQMVENAWNLEPQVRLGLYS